MQQRQLYVARAPKVRPDARRIRRRRMAAFVVCTVLVLLILSRR